MNKRRRVIYDNVGEETDGIVLPQGYTRLNWINGNKIAHVYKPSFLNAPYDVECLVQPVSLGKQCIFGYNNSLQIGYESVGKASVMNATSTNAFFQVGVDALIEVHASSTASEVVYKVDGVNTGIRRACTNSTFCIFTSNGSLNNADCKIYYIKIYQDGVLAKHFVPCLNSSNVPEFYDVINATILSLANSSSALYG